MGARQFLWGLVKKAVVADNCAVIADYALNGEMGNGLGILLGVFFYTIQIYAAFLRSLLHNCNNGSSLPLDLGKGNMV